MNRRSKIRCISFAAAGAAALLAWAIGATATVNEQNRQLAAARELALNRTCEYLEQIDTDLTKAAYAATPAMLGRLADDMHANAAGAKSTLSALDGGDHTLWNLYKFLSQVSAYTAGLQKKTAAGGVISEEERVTVRQLQGYAKDLKRRFSYMLDLLNAGYFSFDAIDRELKQTEDASEQMVSYLGAVHEAEDDLEDFPTLIYDGPFSDHITEKTSALLEGAAEISLQDAKRIAAKAMGAEEKDVYADGPTGGKLASYAFHAAGGRRAAVTVRGGYPAYVLSDAVAGETRLSALDAVSRGAERLRELGYADMVSTYYAIEDGICTVNFALRQDGYVIYPDLIKVRVSLTDGAVVAMDASDYLMNHIQRTVPAPLLTEEEAAEKARHLNVLRTKKAVIPTEGGGEQFAYELLCEDDAGKHVLIYVDTVTGEEDDILILLYADGGTLTK